MQTSFLRKNNLGKLRKPLFLGKALYANYAKLIFEGKTLYANLISWEKHSTQTTQTCAKLIFER